MTQTITVKFLRDYYACEEQVDMFISVFGKDAEVIPTMELAKKYRSEFNIHWLADKLLNSDQKKVYDEAFITAEKAYDEATDLAHKVYYEATDLARKAYYEACALAYKAYNEAVAVAFVKAWNG
jgi:superfamily I DNA/RNA helicase